MKEGYVNRPTSLADYVAIVRRRKWLILAAPVFALIAALIISSNRDPVYQAKAAVLVDRSSVVSAITNVSDPALGDPTRFLATEATTARSTELARRVVALADVPGITPGRLLATSSVKPRSTADILDVSVEAGDPHVALRLTNVYANEFSRYKTELDTQRINEAIGTLQLKINALRARGVDQASPTYATLLQDQGRLETIGKLLANNTRVLEEATGASKVSPRPKRDALLSFLLGGVLGIALALLAEALDRRLRSEEEIEQMLNLPLIARAPKPPRHVRNADHLVMLDEPSSRPAESFRKLRANLEFINLHQNLSTMMVTSATQREGKSTTIANLAVALARAGRRVALVDLDLRRPYLHRFFDLASGPGLTDVAVGRSKLDQALRPIALGTSPVAHPIGHNLKRRRRKTADRVPADAARSANSNGRSGVTGILNFLPAGTIPPSPGEFLESPNVSAILAELSEGFDFVLVDAPPLLAFGDAMTLSGRVDAILVVARLGYVQRPLLHELARQLESSPAKPIGFVLAGAPRSGVYAYGYDVYGYTPAEEPTRKTQRVP